MNRPAADDVADPVQFEAGRRPGAERRRADLTFDLSDAIVHRKGSQFVEEVFTGIVPCSTMTCAWVSRNSRPVSR